MSRVRLVVADSINSVPRSDWEVLTESDVHGQFGWLQALESSAKGAQRPLYFLLFSDGQLTAAAVGYRYFRGMDSGRPGELLFGKMVSLASKLRLTPKKALYIGPIIGHGRQIFWDRSCGADEAIERIHMMIEAILSHDELTDFTIIFGRIPSDEIFLLTALRKLGYLETQSWPISYLDVIWNSFDDYVSSLSRCGKNMPNKARREVAAPKKQGVQIDELEDFESHASQIHRLFEQTHGKYADSHTEFGPHLVKALAALHRQGCVMSIAKTEGGTEMLGAALLITAQGEAAGSLIGVTDLPLNRRAFTYFNLAFYEPIRHCIAQNIHRIYFGGGLRKAKRKRGCKEMAVSIFLRPAGRISGLFWHLWFVVHRNWVRRKSLGDDS